MGSLRRAGAAPMLRYVMGRALWGVGLLLAVSLVVFVIFNLLPSADPARLRAGRQPTPELIETIRAQLGLDRPWPAQYLDYVTDVFLGLDLGFSFQSNADVLSLILARLPATVQLALGAAVLWLAAGIALGVLSAVRRRTLVDRVSQGVALVAISAPVYWLGLVAIYLFSADIGLIPLLPGIGSYVPLTEDPLAWLASMILPWCVLAASFAAIYSRLVRSSLLEVMSEDYIRTARAQGLRERRVVLRHGLRGALTPVVTLAGMDLGVLLGGAILVEAVFNLPGVGRLAYDAILRGDLPVIQGTVLLGAFFIIAMAIVVDVLYAYLDPRVRWA